MNTYNIKHSAFAEPGIRSSAILHANTNLNTLAGLATLCAGLGISGKAVSLLSKNILQRRRENNEKSLESKLNKRINEKLDLAALPLDDIISYADLEEKKSAYKQAGVLESIGNFLRKHTVDPLVRSATDLASNTSTIDVTKNLHSGARTPLKDIINVGLGDGVVYDPSTASSDSKLGKLSLLMAKHPRLTALLAAPALAAATYIPYRIANTATGILTSPLKHKAKPANSSDKDKAEKEYYEALKEIAKYRTKQSAAEAEANVPAPGNPVMSAGNIIPLLLGLPMAAGLVGLVNGIHKGYERKKKERGQLEMLTRAWRLQQKRRDHDYNTLHAVLEEEPSL